MEAQHLELEAKQVTMNEMILALSENSKRVCFKQRCEGFAIPAHPKR